MEQPLQTQTLKHSPKVVTPEQVALVAAHLKERLSPNQYYRERGEKDPEYWTSLAWGMPLLPIPKH